jgi:ATP-dependent phosphofructokinase / diphosphate-dependent phosphofructokinase
MPNKPTAPRNAFYAQSGGVTAVINASAAGVIETARAQRARIGRVFAGRDGILGALTEDLIDTSSERASAITGLCNTPGGAFGSARYKLKGLDEHRAHYERLIEVFRAHDIGYFFYNGGNDSSDTCLKVSQLARQLGYPLTCVHIPKTIDNDLFGTDNCPGFGSVAKYVATSMREAAFDVASMARTSTSVFVLEVMGRHAGWITAAVGLAEDDEHPIPLLLLFPEVPFDQAKFLASVDRLVKTRGYCCIGVSEGLRNADGRFLSESGLHDSFGNAQLGGAGELIARLTRDKLGYKYHWALADYLQRSARHIASRTDLEQAYAVGRAGVLAALAGHNEVMISIVRKSNQPYRWTLAHTPLTRVAGREHMVPRSFIRRDGFGITARARTYLEPLIEGESPPVFRRGLPRFTRLKNTPVPRKLAAHKV